MSRSAITGPGPMPRRSLYWLALGIVGIATCHTAVAQDAGSRPPDLLLLPKFSPLPPIGEELKAASTRPELTTAKAKRLSPSDYFAPASSPATTDILPIPICFESPEKVADDVIARTRHSRDGKRQLFLEFDRQIRLHPDRAELFYQQGISRAVLADRRGETEALATAWSELSEAVKRDATNADFLFARSWVARKMGETTMALSDLSRGLSLRPDHPWALTLRGQIYAERDRCGKAMTDFDRAVAIDPGHERSFDLLTSRASCFAAQGSYDQAVQDLEAAILVHSFDPYLYLLRARYLARIGEQQRARDDINALMQIRPEDPFLRFACNAALVGMGEYARAYRDADQLLRKFPVHPTPYLLRFAASYLAARQRDQQLKTVEDLARRVERLMPTDPAPRFVRVASLALTGAGRDRALKDMEHGLDLMPDLASPHAWGTAVNALDGRLVPTCRHLVLFAMRFDTRRFRFGLTDDRPRWVLWFREDCSHDEEPTVAEKHADKPIAEQARDILFAALVPDASQCR